MEEPMRVTAPFALLLVLIPCGDNVAGSLDERLQRHPWEWSDRERIERRMALQATATNRLATQLPFGKHFVVDGSMHPELFLPGELFSIVVERLTAGGQALELFKKTNLATLRKFGWNETKFWQELEVLARPYASVKQEGDRKLRQAGTSSP